MEKPGGKKYMRGHVTGKLEQVACQSNKIIQSFVLTGIFVRILFRDASKVDQNGQTLNSVGHFLAIKLHVLSAYCGRKNGAYPNIERPSPGYCYDDPGLQAKAPSQPRQSHPALISAPVLAAHAGHP